MMRDEKMGCKFMRCPHEQLGTAVSRYRAYYCCEGCDEADCADRCQNKRAICGGGLPSSAADYARRTNAIGKDVW